MGWNVPRASHAPTDEELMRLHRAVLLRIEGDRTIYASDGHIHEMYTSYGGWSGYADPRGLFGASQRFTNCVAINNTPINSLTLESLRGTKREPEERKYNKSCKQKDHR